MRINKYVSDIEAKAARNDRARHDMHADLHHQREAMTVALGLVIQGRNREAAELLRDSLEYWEKKKMRTKRKTRIDPDQISSV